jgi:hypothetical protein
MAVPSTHCGLTATPRSQKGAGRCFSSIFESPRKLSDQIGDWQATKKPAGTAKAGFLPSLAAFLMRPQAEIKSAQNHFIK